MIRAQVISWWINDGGENKPHAWTLQPVSGSDVTGQVSVPGDPNAVVVELTLSQAQFDALLAHPDYGEGAVLFAEEVTSGIPT